MGRLFGVRPLSTRLLWETGEWDPIAGYHADDDSEDSGDDVQRSQRRRDGRWEQRVMELEEGTKEIGFWIEGKEAKVRVELK